MPGTTHDSALAVKALRRNGISQHWTFGFKATRCTRRSGVRVIHDLEVYSVSPHVDDEPEHMCAAHPAGLEFKTLTAGPASVRLARDGRWVLTCSICGLPSGLSDRPLPDGVRVVCRFCAESAGALVDPLSEPDLDDPSSPDPGMLTIADLAMAEEIELDMAPDGTLERARPAGRA